MRLKTVLIVWTVFALLALLLSCTLSGMSDIEFAKALIKETADTTGVYPTQGKSAGPGDSGISFTINPIPEDPPLNGPFDVTFSFSDFSPSFAPNSTVSGEIVATITYDPNPDNPSVTVEFQGTLTVDGEHAGSYRFEATLYIDLVTGEYEYSGTVTIRETVHDVSK
jgi:hypothetical protein